MFRKTDPQQHLFGVETALPAGMRSRLKASWAEVFRLEILPILLRSEADFGILYGSTGRPNFSVGRMLALCLLQELCDFCDQEALDAFGFDARWQHATDIHADEEAYLSRRSLVEFRSRLVKRDPEMALMHRVFAAISDGAIKKLGLSVREQRLDSTHVASNIHTHGRIDLFQSTLKVFIRSLSTAAYDRLPEAVRTWFETESSGWFGLGTADQKREKLQRLASFLRQLIDLFRQDKAVSGSQEYGLLVQLFGEHCELKKSQESTPDKQRVAQSDPPASDADASGEERRADETAKAPDTAVEAQSGPADQGAQDAARGEDTDKTAELDVVIKRNTSGDTLQSPHDPDATYGHKGVGYSAQIIETCNNEGVPEIITAYEVHGAARSDVGKAPDVLQQLENTQRKPEVLYGDGGYPSVPSMPRVQALNVELVAPVNRGPMDVKTFGRDRFEFNELGQVTRCPAGHCPIDHRILSNGTEPTSHAVFNGDICRNCALLDTCPVRAPNHRPAGASARDTVGNFRLEVTAELRLRDEMYAQQQTPQWKERYKIRSGVEATMSELKGCHGLAKLRVRGLPRVRLAVVCKLIACNIRRWARAKAPANGGADAGPSPALPPSQAAVDAYSRLLARGVARSGPGTRSCILCTFYRFLARRFAPYIYGSFFGKPAELLNDFV